MTHKHILNFWPLVPALDIQAIYEILKSRTIKYTDIKEVDKTYADYKEDPSLPILESSRKDLNILIIGDGLGCLVKTICRMQRHETQNLNIYLVSNFPESVIRSLLLLSLLKEHPSATGLLEKAEYFLEIFGNTLIRASTSDFVKTMSANILSDIVGLRQLVHTVPTACLDFLKQSEIDEICKVLTYLKSEESYNVTKAWENSLRVYFGSRYDNRQNLFDYHFNMKLSKYPIINLHNYLEWCETGIAFNLRKGRYDFPNKTLCLNSVNMGIKSNELYFRDIATSPYVTFGVECGNKVLFETVSNQYKYTSVDISKFNIIDMMTECLSNISEEKKVKINFLFYSTFCKIQKFENMFDVAYVTCDMSSYAENGSLIKLLHGESIVMFETLKNVVNSREELKLKHSEDLNRLAEINGLKPNKIFESGFDSFKVFVTNNAKE